jgi:predicted transcriptional regulator
MNATQRIILMCINSNRPYRKNKKAIKELIDNGLLDKDNNITVKGRMELA